MSRVVAAGAGPGPPGRSGWFACRGARALVGDVQVTALSRWRGWDATGGSHPRIRRRMRAGTDRGIAARPMASGASARLASAVRPLRLHRASFDLDGSVKQPLDEIEHDLPIPLGAHGVAAMRPPIARAIVVTDERPRVGFPAAPRHPPASTAGYRARLAGEKSARRCRCRLRSFPPDDARRSMPDGSLPRVMPGVPL